MADKTLVIIFGPPAVGKMTVGSELAKLTGLKLFHNHMTIEPLLELFEFAQLVTGHRHDGPERPT